MTAATALRSSPAATRRDHLFTVGQIVHLTSEVGVSSQTAGPYRIVAVLPPTAGDSPQYRIRADAEPYERVTTQERLAPVLASPGGEGTPDIEKDASLG